MVVRKAKLPPYVELAIMKIKDGNFEDVDGVTDIILNNLTKDRIGTKGRVGKWNESIVEYWRRVFVTWMGVMKEALKDDKQQWKIYSNYVEMRLEGNAKRKSN